MINEKKMNNKNYNMKKKDVFVIFINLLVLTLVVYTYYTVNNLNTVLSKTSELCVLKTSSNVIFKDNVDDSKMTNENVRIRRTRSTNVVKFQKLSLFSLAQPNVDFEQNGILGPWILSNKSLSVNTQAPIKLMSRRTLFQFIDAGHYLVQIQVYYLSSSKSNSFAMTKVTGNANETLSVCSAAGVYGTEISCFTSTVEYFKTGESVLIRLREMTSSISLNRKVSHTYLSFTKLHE